MEIHCAVQAKWIIPVDTDGDRSTCRILLDHTLCLNCDGVIADIMSNEKFEEHFGSAPPPGGVKVMPPRHVIIPGLINCHTHGGMTMLRGFADDLPQAEWLQKVWEVEAKFVDEEFVEVGSTLTAYESLKSGTTFVNDMYYKPAAATLAFKRAKIRSAVGDTLINIPGRGDKYKQVDEVMSYAKQKPTSLSQPTVVIHSCYTVSEDWLKHLSSEIAKNKKMKRDQRGRRHPPYGIVNIHLHETEKEVQQLANQGDGRSAVQILDDTGLLNDRMIAAHCVHLTDAEIALLAERRVNVAHCPRSNMKLGSGICPVAKLLDAGVNVCLGTDSACSNNSLDLIAEMQFAALLAKGASKDAHVVDGYTALKMATRNGARALGRLNDIGSLEVGKRGDFIAVCLDGFEVAPVFDPLSHLLYTTQRKVTAVWVGGQQVVKQGECVTVSPPLERIQNILRPLRQFRQDTSFPSTAKMSPMSSTMDDETTAAPSPSDPF